jgi:hypothetical protein
MLQKTLSEVERDLKNSEPVSELQTKGKRMVIEEVENSGDEGGKGSADEREDGGSDEGEASFSFWFCKRLFSSGGEWGVVREWGWWWGVCCYRNC